MNQPETGSEPKGDVDLDEPTQEEIDKYFKPKPYVQEHIYDRPLRVPKYLPDEDGKPWETWDYPDLEEFDSDYKIPPPKITIPPGLKIVGNDFDPETFKLKHFGYIDNIFNWLVYTLIFCNSCKLIKYIFLWANEKLRRNRGELMPGDEGYTSSEGE